MSSQPTTPDPRDQQRVGKTAADPRDQQLARPTAADPRDQPNARPEAYPTTGTPERKGFQWWHLPCVLSIAWGVACLVLTLMQWQGIGYFAAIGALVVGVIWIVAFFLRPTS